MKKKEINIDFQGQSGVGRKNWTPFLLSVNTVIFYLDLHVSFMLILGLNCHCQVYTFEESLRSFGFKKFNQLKPLPLLISLYNKILWNSLLLVLPYNPGQKLHMWCHIFLVLGPGPRSQNVIWRETPGRNRFDGDSFKTRLHKYPPFTILQSNDVKKRVWYYCYFAK